MTGCVVGHFYVGPEGPTPYEIVAPTRRLGQRFQPLRPLCLSLLDEEGDPAGMLVEVDDVLNVER
jgi:hypothetical protein